jgi:hypothetical protein
MKQPKKLSADDRLMLPAGYVHPTVGVLHAVVVDVYKDCCRLRTWETDTTFIHQGNPNKLLKYVYFSRTDVPTWDNTTLCRKISDKSLWKYLPAMHFQSPLYVKDGTYYTREPRTGKFAFHWSEVPGTQPVAGEIWKIQQVPKGWVQQPTIKMKIERVDSLNATLTVTNVATNETTDIGYWSILSAVRVSSHKRT